MLVGLDQARLSGVVHHQYQGAVRRADRGHRVSGRHEAVVPLAQCPVAVLQRAFHDDEFHLGPGVPGELGVTPVELDNHGAGAGVHIQAEHFVLHTPAETRQIHVLEVNVTIAERFYVRTCHI